MSMFKSSDFLDEESVQATRLDENLNKLITDGESDIDSREDPELSELLAVGEVLRNAADDVTARSSFKSFHMRSRAAILQSVGEARFGKRVSVLDSLRQKIGSARSTIVSAGAASLATLAIVFAFGASSDANSAAQSLEPKESTDLQVTSTVSTQSANLSQGENDSSPATIRSSGVIITPNQLIESVAVSNSGDYATTLEGVTESLNAIVSAGDAVEVDEIRQLTDYLAQLGFDIRLNPPGNNNIDDISKFQDVIAASVVALNAINTAEPEVLSAVLAGKIVAEDSMGIATRYVNLNLASR